MAFRPDFQCNCADARLMDSSSSPISIEGPGMYQFNGHLARSQQLRLTS